MITIEEIIDHDSPDMHPKQRERLLAQLRRTGLDHVLIKRWETLAKAKELLDQSNTLLERLKWSLSSH